MSNLRVVISCVSFETVKVTQPILDYKADKVYLIHSGKKPPYIDFFNAVTEELDKHKIPHEERNIFYGDFRVVMKTVRDIIKKEKEEGNHIYVNIGAGPQIYSSAAMIASMMEGATPFNPPVEEFTVKDVKSAFYEKGKPIGNAKKVKKPVEIPVFDVTPPDPDLIKGLSIWKDVTDKWKIRPTREVMIELERNGLLVEIFRDDGRKKISQSALMRYRRNFLEKWESEGWIEKVKRRIYTLTDQGEMILSIFG